MKAVLPICLSRDESDLSLSGQHALCYPVQQLE